MTKTKREINLLCPKFIGSWATLLWINEQILPKVDLTVKFNCQKIKDLLLYIYASRMCQSSEVFLSFFSFCQQDIRQDPFGKIWEIWNEVNLPNIHKVPNYIPTYTMVTIFNLIFKHIFTLYLLFKFKNSLIFSIYSFFNII